MNLNFLAYLVDPQTRENLAIESINQEGENVITGFLISSTNRFPIINGIPRFVASEEYTKSFGWQWNKWSRLQFDSENIKKPMDGHTRKMWHKITTFSIDERRNVEEVILDIGCGPGRFIETVREKNPNALIIGVDYSNAVEAAKRNFKHDDKVCIIQADALRLPIASKTIDGAYTIGVLHHTPNPYKGVEEAYRVLKSSSWFAISVYGKGGFYNFLPVQFWRKIFKLLWPIFGEKLPLAYTYLTINLFRPIARISRPVGLIIRVIFPFANLPDKNWSLLDTFDAVTPSYQSAHYSEEIKEWLVNAGFKSIEATQWGSTSYRGIMP